MEIHSKIYQLCKLISYESSQTSCIEMVQTFSTEDWEDLHAVASRHGLVLILNRTLREYENYVTIPKALMVHMQHVYLRSYGSNFRKFYQIEKILNALQTEGIPVIGLKGVYLVENFYDNIGLRTFHDIDLMVPKDKLLITIKCLQDLGYHLSTYFNIDDINHDIKHIPPMVNQDGLIIEIHWTILEEDEPFSIETNGLWQRAIRVRIAEVDIHALGHEDLILHLCIHLAYQHHLIMGLRNLFDIHTVIKTCHNEIDWDLLVTNAKSWGVERIVWLSFNLLDDIFNVKFPANVIENLIHHEVQLDILIEAKEQLLSDRKEGVRLTPDLIGLSYKTGLINKIKLIISRIFISKQAIARIYNLPASSPKICYCYLRRLIDLSKDYSGSAWRFIIKDPSTLKDKQNLQKNLALVNWMAKRTSSSQSVFLKE